VLLCSLIPTSYFARAPAPYFPHRSLISPRTPPPVLLAPLASFPRRLDSRRPDLPGPPPVTRAAPCLRLSTPRRGEPRVTFVSFGTTPPPHRRLRLDRLLRLQGPCLLLRDFVWRGPNVGDALTSSRTAWCPSVSARPRRRSSSLTAPPCLLLLCRFMSWSRRPGCSGRSRQLPSQIMPPSSR
jgi:hypothetical protein